MPPVYVLLYLTIVWMLALQSFTTIATCPYSSVSGAADLSGVLSPSLVILQKNDLVDCPKNATTLILSGNSLQTLDGDVFDDFWNLFSISLSHNQINSLPSGLLKNMRSLKNFDASNNMLVALADDLFMGQGVHLSNLETINFSHNNISDIGFNVFHKDMALIKSVELSYNSLVSFEPWPYIPQTDQNDKLDVHWNFQHNFIASFTNKMNWSYDLTEEYEFDIQLQYNQLTSLNTDTITVYHPGFNGDYLTEFLTFNINVTENPFHCDCQPYVYVSALHESLLFYFKIEESRMRCTWPPHLRGIDFFHDIELDEFVCNRTTSCPSGCFCQERPNSYDLFVDCRDAGLISLPLALPHATYGNISLHLDNNNIEYLTQTNYSHQISNLTISNNQLASIDSSVIKSMNNLKYLNVENNRINYIPKELQLLAFSNVSISGNPLLCDCNMTWMAEWINLSPQAKDSQITCDDDGESLPISTVTEDTLLCSYDKIIIILSVTLGVVIGLVGAVSITAKRCPYETKVLLYKFFNIHPRDKYKVDQEPDKEYDAYISYYQGEQGESIQVRQWMKRVFLKKLEERSKRRYTVFCFQRDNAAGNFRSDEISDNMGKSRRILLILSPEFLKDDWCIFEADQAEYEHNSSESVHGRVIYIIWNKQMFAQLQEEPWKSRLKDKRVMCPDDKLFWSKMRYELPVKTMRRTNRNETMPFSNGVTREVDNEYVNNRLQSITQCQNNEGIQMEDLESLDHVSLNIDVI
ncbi:protein toll-like [Mizuhopecten yessoensis]|uniref:Protein toll n=1 Tax=Mizuhopecten yessoensis TaxID=6573 RepID=A0A210QZH1_MIZYE|nr:protein toll-like [Mizuhopecten yessoensis]XP_021346044.1 protein toll-like [Mizuhopecten yessoensis]OWF54065.1 Protein toll [Mizuhopecten yessoensis]